jgi:signal transduction histidine kinase
VLKVADSFFVATNKGLYTWRKGAPFVRPFRVDHPAIAGQPHINSLALAGNKLWMAFTSEGVGCLDLVKGNLKLYNTDNSLRNNIAYSILADPKGRIWVSGVAGLAVIFPDEDKTLYYTFQDGLQGNEFTNFCYWQNGPHLYFGGPNGLSVIDATYFQSSAAMPVAVFSRLEVLEGAKFREWGNWSNLSFSHDQNSFNVFLSVSDAGLQHRIEYLYRLLPVERAWISNGAANSLSFTNLPPGDYTLEVKAVTDEAEQGAKPVALHFTVDPAWWQTAWFKAGVVLLLAGALFYIVRLYYLARLRRQRAEYEKLLAVQAERQRISTEIHDDLGAGLSGIRLLTELTRKKAGNSELHTEVDKIYTSVSELTGKMREVIWSLNRENDTLENLLYYLQRQAYKLFEPSGTEISVQLPGNMPDVTMTGEKRRHIYLAVNEALHNCLKHAGAARVWLKMETDNAQLNITVKDNGKGLEKNRSEGNGLRNMQRHMEEVNGTFLVRHQNGTIVQFSVPFK